MPIGPILVADEGASRAAGLVIDGPNLDAGKTPLRPRRRALAVHLASAQPGNPVLDPPTIVEREGLGGRRVIEAAQRDPVDGLIGVEVEPFAVAAIVEQACFMEDERLDFGAVAAEI